MTAQTMTGTCFCGGHVLTEHPGMGLTGVYAAILPKLKDDPMELGGSGVTLAE